MTVKDYIRKKVLGILGYSRIENMPKQEEKLTFINDTDLIIRGKVREYNIWYEADSDELLNFYTQENVINYHREPFYSRNKKNYFWATSSTEGGIKRTNSGQAKNIVDTLKNIVGVPDIKGGHPKLEESNKINTVIQEIIEENDFLETMYKEEQMPLTFVEGWGCYKVVWDKDISDNPIPVYYRAEDVEFIYKLNRIVGVIFKDYYTDGKKKFLITETRYTYKGNLRIETELFEMFGGGDDDYLKPIDITTVDEFKHIDPKIEVTNYKRLLAVPCVFYKDSSGLMHGKSIFSGKVDLLDDLYQALSQSSNALRKSTPVEYFDVNFLERDKHGMPKQPKLFDRKYVFYKGAMTADGSSSNASPVQATQPQINFEQYSNEAVAILLQIINGLISPATLGMDIAKKDNADAQREKEKVTVFTRNDVTLAEQKILKKLFTELLCAKELMDTNQITVTKYNISVTFPDFADDSFENKIQVLGEQLDKGTISYKMYLDKLYNGKLSESEYKQELEFLEEKHKDQEEGGSYDPKEPEGFDMHGQNDPELSEGFQEQDLV